jgi:hypothetical protein
MSFYLSFSKLQNAPPAGGAYIRLMAVFDTAEAIEFKPD